MRYLANFSDEIAGEQHEPGDEVTVDLDQGTIDYLAKHGRVTVLDDADPQVTAVGAAGADAPAADVDPVPEPQPEPAADAE